MLSHNKFSSWSKHITIHDSVTTTMTCFWFSLVAVCRYPEAWNVLISYFLKNTNKSFDILREETITEIKSIKEHNLISAHKRYYTRLHPKLKDFSTEVSSLLKSFYTLDVFRAKSQSVVYNYNKQNKKLIKNIESILHNCFSSMRSLISRPIL